MFLHSFWVTAFGNCLAYLTVQFYIQMVAVKKWHSILLINISILSKCLLSINKQIFCWEENIQLVISDDSGLIKDIICRDKLSKLPPSWKLSAQFANKNMIGRENYVNSLKTSSLMDITGSGQRNTCDIEKQSLGLKNLPKHALSCFDYK